MALPNDKDIERPLLLEIEAMGGEARPQDLYPKVTAHFPQITEADLKEITKTGANRWINRIQFIRHHLVLKGELERYPRGVWRITQKGRERLRREGPSEERPVVVELAKPIREEVAVPSDPDKLAGEVKSLVEKLVQLAKKGKEETPRLSHDELAQRVKEMGAMLGKTAEGPWGPIYKHDCVWKDNPYANPKIVVEVCNKGNLDKDIASLLWAVKNWGAKGILVLFEESDFHAAQKKLTQESQIYPLKADDMLRLHSILKAGNIQAIRSIFGV